MSALASWKAIALLTLVGGLGQAVAEPPAERAPGGSRVYWPVVAAAVVERLPGDTLRAKLGVPPGRDRIAAALARDQA